MIDGQRLERTAIACARGVGAAFFLGVAVYEVIVYAPFIEQGIRYDPILTELIEISPWLCLVSVLIAVLTLMPHLRGGRHAVLARAYVLVMSAVTAWAFVAQPLKTNHAHGLTMGLAALVPPLWLALIDHVIWPAPPLMPTPRARIVASAWLAAAVAWLVFAVAVPVRLGHVAGIDLPGHGLRVGLGASLVFGLFVWTIVLLALLAVSGIAAYATHAADAEYWMLVAVFTVCAALILTFFVAPSIGFPGFRALIASGAIAVTVGAVWAGVARMRGVSGTAVDSLSLFCAPVAGVASPAAARVMLVALPLVAYFGIEALATVDWNFVLQKLGVLIVWLIAFGAAHAALGAFGRRTTPSVRRDWMVAVASLTIFAAYHAIASADTGVVFDRYAPVDPAFRLIRDAQTIRPAETVEYYAYLSANTLVTPGDVQTPAIEPPVPTPQRKPDIYLFVVDSMRPDYLSPYNPKVTFTPAIGQFARDSVVFERAFSRYSGTALAVPSIWAGGSVIHTLGKTPFIRRDSLRKLLDANGYVRIMDRDLIISDLEPSDSEVVELDHNRITMQFDICKTVEELEQRVTENGGRRPVFFYALPQNVHLSTALGKTLPKGESYPGFNDKVASAVHGLDTCVGGFVEFLRRTNRYDNSIVILTADHGDSLGEDGRWSHGIFLSPEVVRIPLIVHVPPWLRENRSADLSAVSFTSDIAPSLYALLGYDVADRGPLFGRPLFVPPDADVSWRRKERFLLASSYGPVYAMLNDNGRELFVVNAADGTESLFDVVDNRPATQRTVTRSVSDANRALIRERLAALAALYHFQPRIDLARGAPTDSAGRSTP